MNENMTIKEYINILNDRNTIEKEVSKRIDDKRDELKLAYHNQQLSECLRDIIHSYFKHNVKPDKKRRGIIYRGDEYAMIDEEIKVRKYRCHQFHAVYNYGSNKFSDLFNIFSEIDPEFVKYVTHIQRAIEQLEILNNTIPTKFHDKYITTTINSVTHMARSYYSEEDGQIITKPVTLKTIILKSTSYGNYKFEIIAGIKTPNGHEKEYFIDDEYFDAFLGHQNKILNLMDELLTFFKINQQHFDQVLEHPEYKKYLLIGRI